MSFVLSLLLALSAAAADSIIYRLGPGAEQDTYTCQSFKKGQKTALATEPFLHKCLNKENGIEFLISLESGRACIAYNKNLKPIAIQDKEKCKDQYLIHDPQTNKKIKFTKMPGLEKMNHQQILEWLKSPMLQAGGFCESIEKASEQMCSRMMSFDSECQEKYGKESFAWDLKSCRDPKSDQYVSEILSLKEDQSIREAIFEKESEEKIERSLVFWYFQNVDRKTSFKDDYFAKNNFDNSKYKPFKYNKKKVSTKLSITKLINNFKAIPIDLKECLSNTWQSMKTNDKGQLLPQCQPDTLYSWGPEVKLEALKKWMGKEKWIGTMVRTLYLARDPVTTFGYGPIPVRVKLKKGVKFVQGQAHNNCSGHSPEQIQTSVFFRNDGYYSDWGICSPAVIHSWSHSRPEHLAEINKSYETFEKFNGKQIGNFDVYSSGQSRCGSFFCDRPDGHDFSLVTFNLSRQNFQKRIEQKQAEIFYNPDLPEDEKNPETHFSTEHPIYFNEE